MTYRRRRVVAAGLALLAMFTAWYLVHGLFAFLHDDARATPMETISATRPLPGDDTAQYVTVRPGDTLWTIAQEIQPKGDIRPVLHRLTDRYGATPLIPGTNISVS
jgi:hypothetical protein